jgi:hypothetical protein
LIAVLLLVNYSSFAQTDTKREKIDALRTAFINNRVNFTPKEAQAFWPLYNEMNDKLDAVRKTFRQKYNSNTNYNFQTDKEAEDYLNAELTLKQKEYELYKDYYDKFKKILSVKQVAAVRRAEEDFRKEIIKSIKDN